MWRVLSPPELANCAAAASLAAERDRAATEAVSGVARAKSVASRPRPPEALTTLFEPVRPLARAAISFPDPPLSIDRRLSFSHPVRAPLCTCAQNPLRSTISTDAPALTAPVAGALGAGCN